MLAEAKVVAAVREQVADVDSLHYILERVEAEGERLCSHLPEDLKLKRAALAGEEHRIANFIESVGAGKGTRALGEAVAKAIRVSRNE